ncbi:MAG: hypothetical protein JNJ65_10975 [Cyclobacteriaceae bacterium]|nr:hypothetical protein [Cyclobacteriaceae bacterium]
MAAQPSLYLFHLRIDEPVNMLTDLIVSAVCFYALFQLRKRSFTGRTFLYLQWYFGLLGLATLLGGLLGHGFLYAFSFAWKLPGWIVSMFSVALIERSSIEHAKSRIAPAVGNFFLVLNILELLTVMSVTIYTLNFGWVEFHSGYGLLAVVLPFHGYVFLKSRDQGSAMMMVGVSIASVAAVIYMNEISISPWFNYIDISHVLMAVAVYVFYRAALKLKQPQPQVTVSLS